MSDERPGVPIGPVAGGSPDAQGAVESSEPADQRRRLTTLPLGSWIRKLPARQALKGAASGKPPPSGLDEREHRFSVAATVLALGLVIAGYLVNRHSTVVKVRDDVSTLLIAGLVLIAIMLAGIVFRRGSLVGIASFMMGFELVAAEDIFGALFLVFGGWLLVRGMRRQRAAMASGTQPTRAVNASQTRATGPPKPSKRYTPPHRSRTGARRR